MNLGSTSDPVRSKYFTNGHAIDESLSDFQETKKSCKGPKTVQKPSKTKAKKVAKRSKGQKDIRAVINAKKNDLIKYSKEFDNVCKQSGIDVDSEQLQLAITLSKSLQTDESSSTQTTKTLTSQDRVSKIRTTLQEYGFKVPETKIILGKKNKKIKKQYKLLNTSEEERHQKISGKYTQILFESLDTSRLDDKSSTEVLPHTLFFIATNLPYEYMKNNEIFYVDNLIEKSMTNGSLLRDWSEIPGRPVSPMVLETNIMNISEITCSQDELDVIFSGSMRTVKDLLGKKKYINTSVPTFVINDERDPKGKERNISERNVIIELKSPTKQILTGNEPKEGIDLELDNLLTVTKQYRSCSPDIFDDEPSIVLEDKEPIHVLPQENKTKVYTEDNFMDLTECTNNVVLQKSQLSLNTDQCSQNTGTSNKLALNVEEYSQRSQNITRRKSDDYMEITDCIVETSQVMRQTPLQEIDLTQSCEEKDSNLNKYHDNSLGINVKASRSFSNTLSFSNSATDKENVTDIDHVCNSNLNQTPNSDMDVTQESDGSINEMTAIEEYYQAPDCAKYENIDLTQSSSSSVDINDLPVINVGSTQNSLDDTVILNEDEYLEANGKVKETAIPLSLVIDRVIYPVQEQNNSITNQNDYSQPSIGAKSNSCNQSFFDEFVHDHSESSKEVGESNNFISDMNNPNSKVSDDIDLTQSSDTSERSCVEPVTTLECHGNLGKLDDVSIDYDEVCDVDQDIGNKSDFEIIDTNDLQVNDNLSKSQVFNDLEVIDEIPSTSNMSKSRSLNYSDIDAVEKNNDILTNSSHNSTVFDISDKELNYSMHQSRLDVPVDYVDFGGISVLDDITRLRTSKSVGESNQTKTNATLGDSFLPEVNINKNREVSLRPIEANTKVGVTSPTKILKDLSPTETPKNNEFLVKTDEVTPMLDYASMTTPQRNRELDRYGLKPFKRKRAIQILTHIYNQTHPLVDSYTDEDHPTPSKKQRQNSPEKNSQTTFSSNIGPTNPSSQIDSVKSSPIKSSKSKSPKKINAKSPRKGSKPTKMSSSQSPKKDKLKTNNKEIDVKQYEVTSEVPVIRSIDCTPEDWVFQKREKAKLHSCRMPLHVAFHNYVSSRRSLREAILKYEPVNIDVIHKELVAYGHRYDPKELLRFMDKKCITVKTQDNNARNNKR